MNKLLGGGAAFGFAALGTFALAGPGAAQAEPLQATIEPTSVPQGGTVTIASEDACVDGEGEAGRLVIDIFFEDATEPFQKDNQDLVTEEDPELNGQWAFDYTGEPNEEVGTYTYVVTCFPDDPEAEAIGQYVPLSAETVAAPTPTTEPPVVTPPPTPAAPVTRTPSLTG